jgi:hypothetical protein
MRFLTSVPVMIIIAAVVGLGGFLAYRLYINSQPPSFSAERFARLCRPQLEAALAPLRKQRREELETARTIYLYGDASTPEKKAEYQLNLEYAQTAFDEVRVNGIFSKDGFLAKNADNFGRMDETMARSWLGYFQDDPVQAAAMKCMVNAKLAELQEKAVGDEALDAPGKAVDVPLKQGEQRVAFRNGCGAVMQSNASHSALDDTVWMGACSFGLAHGKGMRAWHKTLTPVTYYYGYDITPGQQGGDGATGNPAEIAARFKPLETARLQKLRAMLAARAAHTPSTSQGKGR